MFPEIFKKRTNVNCVKKNFKKYLKPLIYAKDALEPYVMTVGKESK